MDTISIWLKGLLALVFISFLVGVVIYTIVSGVKKACKNPGIY